MILSNQSLKQWAVENVSNFNHQQFGSCSFDLTLSNKLRQTRYDKTPWYKKLFYRKPIIDLKTNSKIIWSEEETFTEFILYPGRLALLSSNEVTNIPDDMAAILVSRSSAGRIGLEHLHSGFGDSGFMGNWTFEFYNTSPYPIRLHVGERLVQLVLFRLDTLSDVSYRDIGRYYNQSGVTANR